MEYTSFLEEYEYALAREKLEVASWEATLANQKANMSANKKSFKSSFAEVSHISKELNDASMSKYMKKTASI